MVGVVVIAAVAGVLVGLSGPLGDSAAAAAPAPHCLKALVAQPEGAVPFSENFAPVACPSGAPAHAFRHDEALRTTRIAHAIAPGEIVPLYPEYGADMVLPGQTLHLVVFAGAARIERDVEALQPARPGQRLFVKSSDGEILSVRYQRSTP